MTDQSLNIEELPVLGVGVSLSLGTNPDPVQLARQAGGPDFVEYAGAVDVSVYAEQVSAMEKQGIPMLYHPSCLNLCGPWPNPKSWLARVNHHVETVKSAWLAQDVSVCFIGEEPGYSIELGYFVPPILTEDSLAEAIVRVREVREAVQTPLLLEPAPVTCLVGDMPIYVWLSRLAQATDSGILLDAGHVVAHQLALGRQRHELTEGLEELDWDRVVELHVAGGSIQAHPEDPKKAYYLDAHDLPVLDETWAIFRTLLQRAKNLKAVCFECESSATASILWMLAQVRERVVQGTANAALKDRVQQQVRGMSP